MNYLCRTFLILFVFCGVSQTFAQRNRPPVRPGDGEEIIVKENFRGNEVRRGYGLLRTEEPLTPPQIEEIEKLFSNSKFPVSVTRISDRNIYVFKSKTGDGTTARLFEIFNQIFKENPRSLVITPNLEPDLLVHVDPKSVAPATSMPGFWGLERIGLRSVTGVNGSRNLVVAVLDTGISYDHNDLSVNVWSAPGDYIVDRVKCLQNSHGFTFIIGLPDRCLVPDTSRNGHGTAVSGVIGAVKHDDFAEGVTQEISLIAVRVLDRDGSGDILDTIKGLEFVRQMKRTFPGQQFRLVNYSATVDVSPDNQSDLTCFRTALEATVDDGIIVVSAAGNDKKNLDENEKSCTVYPACFKIPGVIAVSASTESETILNSSNWGAQTVHIAAPGTGLKTTGHAYADAHRSFSNTSSATPVVSGAAALLMDACPLLTNVDVINILLNSANRKSPDIRGKVQSGRLDVFAAIQTCRQPYFKSTISLLHPYGEYELNLRNRGNP